MKRLLLVFAFFALCLVGPVQAQDSSALARLEISLWPEFDRSEVLVIYRGELDATVALPAAMEIAIPARVGLPTAVAYVDEAGQRLTQEYSTRVEGDLLVVAFELSTQGFQLEYYDALPVDASGKRTYTFAYTADYDLAELNLEFQQPPTATGLVLNPPADTAVVGGGDGLTYHLLQAGALAAGDTWNWTFTYTKDNSDLTAAGSVKATAEAAAPAPAGARNSTIWIALIALVVLIGVGVGGYWFGNRSQAASRAQQSARRSQAAPRKRRGSGRGGQPQQPKAATEGEARFCHQCGIKLRSDSAFCHECGTSVRSE